MARLVVFLAAALSTGRAPDAIPSPLHDGDDRPGTRFAFQARLWLGTGDEPAVGAAAPGLTIDQTPVRTDWAAPAGARRDDDNLRGSDGLLPPPGPAAAAADAGDAAAPSLAWRRHAIAAYRRASRLR